jgi:hypothetical protein
MNCLSMCEKKNNQGKNLQDCQHKIYHIFSPACMEGLLRMCSMRYNHVPRGHEYISRKHEGGASHRKSNSIATSCRAWARCSSHKLKHPSCHVDNPPLPCCEPERPAVRHIVDAIQPKFSSCQSTRAYVGDASN